jgi:hypothetical protein
MVRASKASVMFRRSPAARRAIWCGKMVDIGNGARSPEDMPAIAACAASLNPGNLRMSRHPSAGWDPVLL